MAENPTATDVAAAATPRAGVANLSEWLRIRRDPIGLLQGLQAMGDIVPFQRGSRRSYLLFHPELVKDVLVTHHRSFGLTDIRLETKPLLGNGLLHSEGELHKRQRRLANPAFHHTRIAQYADVMTDYASRASERWRNGDVVDIQKEMMELTLGVVGKTLYDTDLDRSDLRTFREALNVVVDAFRVGSPAASMLREMPLAINDKVKQALRVIDEMVYRLIGERRQGGEDHGDLLSMLIRAHDEEGDGGGMTDQQVRDEAVTLGVAGHETTANALSWTWYSLAQHPEVEVKLHAELATVLGGRVPTLQDLPQLTYARNVIAEAIRPYPPAWLLMRRAVEDVKVGDETVPAGASVFFFPYLLHRDPRWWPDPDRFNPDRWTEAAEADRPKYAYIPFGAGPRMCIGEQFAWMEATLVVAVLAQRWQPRLEPGQRVMLEPKINLRPRGGLPMRLEARA
ncbi:MAG: cytochrome P450 [Actinomycetota bacterium]